MRIRSLLSGAVITLLLLVLIVLSTPASSQEITHPSPPTKFEAEELFKKSDAECRANEYEACASLQTSGITLRTFIEAFLFTESLLLEANGWNSSMLDVEIPVDYFFKVLPSNP